jgi:hypothetical protein
MEIFNCLINNKEFDNFGIKYVLVKDKTILDIAEEQCLDTFNKLFDEFIFSEQKKRLIRLN